MNNNIYNLINQLTQENKSLWRIKDIYKKDSEGNEELIDFWNKLEKEKESQIEELKGLIKKYI